MTTARPMDYNFSTTAMSQPSNKTSNPIEQELEDYHVGLITLSVLILVCNVFAIQTYKRHEKIQRNCSNVLLLSLACSDLIVGVVYLPILIFCETQYYNYMPENKAFMHTCRINHLVGLFSGFSTVFHIIALTLEKYLGVLHPFQRLSVSTRGTYRKILAAIWLLALSFAVVPLFWLYDNPNSPQWLENYHIYGIVQASIFLGVASVLLLYCYIRMFFQIHVKLSVRTQTGRVQTKARNDRKTIFIFILFFTIFIVGWAPWFFFNLKKNHVDLVAQKVKDFLVSLRFAGAVLNPLLYTFIKNDYKQAIQSDIRALCSKCAGSFGFQKLIQTNTMNRAASNNNNTRRGTLSTGIGEVKLVKVGSNHDTDTHSSASGAPEALSQAEDTDL